MERELRLFQVMLSYLDKLLDGIDDHLGWDGRRRS